MDLHQQQQSALVSRTDSEEIMEARKMLVLSFNCFVDGYGFSEPDCAGVHSAEVLLDSFIEYANNIRIDKIIRC